MRISVALCTYNGGRYLSEQLASIAGQLRSPYEVVICDDCSSDLTLEIIAEFAATVPFPVRLFRNEENLGSTKNFEKAIRLCEGDLIALCDQDDVWYPHKLERLMSVFRSDSALGGAFSDADLIDENSQPLGRRLWKRAHFEARSEQLGVGELASVLLKSNVVTGATLIFRADMREMLLPIPASWVHDGWIAWILTLYSKVASVSEPLTKYRIHGFQQIGVGPLTLRGKIIRAKETGRRKHESSAKDFDALRDRFLECPFGNSAVRLKELEARIQHEYMRARLPANRFLRAYKIVCVLHKYQRYSRGLTSACMDLLADLN